MSVEEKYDPSKSIPTLEQILKLPIVTLSPKALADLKSRRQYLADIFFSKEKAFGDKVKVQDELSLLHTYLGMKDIRKMGGPKATAPQRTIEQRMIDSKEILNLWPVALQNAKETDVIKETIDKFEQRKQTLILAQCLFKGMVAEFIR